MGPRFGAEAQVGVRALLGPTNTGKTHRAVERMLEHHTGMMGLPLRLLAREIYDRVVSLRGVECVALITGEEKRVPKSARYWVCTVEAMPLSLEVDFLAVDEVQMVGHRQRGHVFTDRLLHARGSKETWFMGAQTVRGLIQDLVPTAEFDQLQRLSQLRHKKPVSLGALRPRSAVVAFSAEAVYEIAERLRARRGGAAVVLGALSPRARNAQVAMYQSGEVDFLVATDAIGMGLNMDVDQVVFAGTSKFDGEAHRPLGLQELAQIAGRAGRNQRDGSFSVLAPHPDLSPATVRSLEEHRFAPLKLARWRNSALDFESLDSLRDSLRRRVPERRPLRAAPMGDDHAALEKLAQRDDVRAVARGRGRVQLLWEVCQVPDFRKLLLGAHVDMLSQIYLQLTGPGEELDSEWMRVHIERIDNVEGSIDLLMTRMAFIRTWTYVAGQSSWVAKAQQWQQRTHAIEDRLSDALHEALVARFVESAGAQPAQTSVAGKGPAPRTRRSSRAEQPAPTPAASSPFFKLAAMRDAMSPGQDAGEGQGVSGLLARMGSAGEGAMQVDGDGAITFEGEPLARLSSHPRLESPNLELADHELASESARALREQLQPWLRAWVAELLAPLEVESKGTSDAQRGCLHALRRGLGTAALDSLGLDMRALRRADKVALRERGVVLGKHFLFASPLLKRGALHRRRILVMAHVGRGTRMPPKLGAAKLCLPEPLPVQLCLAMGYVDLGLHGEVVETREGENESDSADRGMWVWRVDAVERALRQLSGGGGQVEALRARVGKTLELPTLEHDDDLWHALLDQLGFVSQGGRVSARPKARSRRDGRRRR